MLGKLVPRVLAPANRILTLLPTKKERRNKIAETSLVIQHKEDHIRHASCLVRQGVWIHWEKVMPFDPLSLQVYRMLLICEFCLLHTLLVDRL